MYVGDFSPVVSARLPIFLWIFFPLWYKSAAVHIPGICLWRLLSGKDSQALPVSERMAKWCGGVCGWVCEFVLCVISACMHACIPLCVCVFVCMCVCLRVCTGTLEWFHLAAEACTNDAEFASRCAAE